MLVIILIAVSIIASQGVNLSYKFGSMRMKDSLSSPPLMCTFTSLFISLVYGVMALVSDGGIFFPDKLSIVLSLMLGICYAIAAYFYLLALACGPYTITAILLNLSSFLPILYSSLFLGEDASVFQLIGLAIIIASCVVLTISRSHGTQNSKANIRWGLFALFMFISNSLISFSIRVNTVLTTTPKSSFFFLAYLISAALCFIFYLISGGVKKKIGPKPLILPALCVGISIAIQFFPSAELPKYLTSALQYPLEKGLSIILGVVVGISFFKEKIGKAGYICIGTIIAAMCLLGL